MWNEKTLWELRREISLGSIYISDYKNSFHVDARLCCEFFDGYLDYLEEIMNEDVAESKDFWNRIKHYDTSENLFNWYGCFERNPIPVSEKISSAA